MSVLYAAAMLALAGAALVSVRAPRAGALVAAAGCAGLVVVGLHAALASETTRLGLGDWLGFGHGALRADGLAGLFLALAGVTGAAVSLALAELPAGRRPAVLHATLLLFVATAIGADNGFLFLLAWELLTACIFLMAAADSGRERVLERALLTGGLTRAGGAAVLAAFGLLYARTGSFSLSAWADAAPGMGSGTRDAVFLLLLAGFATKVGVVPLQGALPAGYGASPRTAAASMSVALTAGFYGLWRFIVEMLDPAALWWAEALLVLGALTAIGGVLYALTQDDLRRFLGFSTVEHTGIALTGLGVALLGQAAQDRRLVAAGLLAATLHVTAHGLAKTLALMGADRIEVATGGVRGMDGLGGLSRRLPVSSASLGAAALTLAAIPPLGGFVSEWFTFEALLQGFRAPTLAAQLLCALAAAALALTAGLGLLAFAKLLGFTVLGPPRGAGAAAVREAGPPFSVAGLGVLVVVLGALAPWEVHLLGSGLQATIGFDPAASVLSHPLVLGPVFADFSVLAPTWLALVLPAFAVIAAGLVALRGRPAVRRAPVWVSGSGAPIEAVQYRPASYVNPERVVLRGVLGHRSETSAQEDGTLRLETRVTLAVDQLVYEPLTRLALWITSWLKRLQSGRLGDYLLYILAALIVLLALLPAVL